MRIVRWLLAAVGCLAGASCATVVSEGEFAQMLRRDDAGNYYLPRTILNIRSYVDAKTQARELTISAAIEADPGAALRFAIIQSAFSDDVIDIKAKDGLLTSVTSDTTDRTGEIAKNIAKIVFTTATGGADLSARGLPDGATSLAASRFAASYDPLDAREASVVRRRLADEHFCILVGNETLEPPESACAGAAPPALSAIVPVAYVSRAPGIYYRRPRPLPIRVLRRAGRGWTLIWSGSENLFDKETLYQVTLDRAACVRKQIILGFEAGELTGIKIDKKSELAGCTEAMVEVAKHVMGIPLAGLQQDKALLDAQKGKLDAEAGLIQAQRELLALSTRQAAEPNRYLITPNYGARALAIDGGDGRSLDIAANAARIQRCLTEIGASEAECRQRVAREGF